MSARSRFDPVLATFVVGIIAIIVAIVVLAATSTDPDADACRAAGGTVNSSSKAAGGISAKGKYVTTIVTINTCLDKKGLVTNVW